MFITQDPTWEIIKKSPSIQRPIPYRKRQWMNKVLNLRNKETWIENVEVLSSPQTEEVIYNSSQNCMSPTETEESFKLNQSP